MHECFVLQQLMAVILAETGIAAQTNASRAGCRFCDQVRVEFDIDLVMDEKTIKCFLQFTLYDFRRQAIFGFD